MKLEGLAVTLFLAARRMGQGAEGPEGAKGSLLTGKAADHASGTHTHSMQGNRDASLYTKQGHL